MVANTKNKRLSGFRLKPLHVINPFTVRNALWLSLPAGLILTGIMTLGHIDTETWTLAPNFHPALILALNCALFFVLFLFVFSIVKSKLPVAWRFVLATVGSLLIAAVFSLLSIGLQHLIYEEFMIDKAYSGNIIKDGLIVITTIMITLLIYNLSRRHQMMLENERLQSENLLVHYETLESQLDPHFLFNSLNTLSGLIGMDDDKAQEYLQQLASTFRYTIQQNKLVPINDELRFADAYLNMMNIRYGNNLKVVRQLDGVEGYVVPISVQQLIENALKHNVVSDKHPLEIRIEVTENSTLRVSNRLCPKETTESEGVGLANLDKRYELIAGEHISMYHDNEQFVVEIPLISRQKAMEILDRMKEEAM